MSADVAAPPCKGAERAGSRQRARDDYLVRTYGITRAERDALAVRQGQACAICRRSGKLHVDHDHATGVVRGLLCQHCNWGLGHFSDKAKWLLAAVDYLASTTQTIEGE